MKVHQLDIGHVTYQKVKIKSSKSVAFTKNSEVQIFKENSSYFLRDLADKKLISEIQGENKEEHQNIERITSLNLPRISFIVDDGSLRKDNIIVIQTNEFTSKIEQNIEIALTDDILDKISKTNKKITTIESLSDWLCDECVLNKYKIFSIIKDDKKEDGNSFIIIGNTVRLFIKKKNKENNEYFYLSKVVKNVGKNDREIIRIIEGQIKFCNESRVDKIRAETIALMEEIKHSEESYIEIWKKYQKIETDIIVENIRNFGALNYNSKEVLPDGTVRIDIVSASELKKISYVTTLGDRLEISDSVHPLIDDPSLCWSDYSESKKNKKSPHREVVYCELKKAINLQQAAVFININLEEYSKIPENGYIYLSISGDEKRISRRDEAIEKILMAKSPMPHLPLIIEGKTPAIPRKKTIYPISQIVQEKIFPIYPPTSVQRDAIDIALNTPDIAIIQGPPGTGKTTVITAIIERLNELNNNMENISGNYLISGFQHDAVENAIDRIEVNGLPTPKFGKKRGKINDDTDIIDYKIDNWRLEKKANLEKTVPSIRETNYYRDFYKLANGYFLSPGDLRETLKLLQRCKTILNNNISSRVMRKLSNQINLLSDEIRTNNNLKSDEILKNIWRIPVNEDMYNDDGRNCLMKVILRLKSEECLDETTEKHLKTYCFKMDLSLSDYDDLKQIRKQLLLKHTPIESLSVTPKSRDDITTLLSEIKTDIEHIKTKSKNSIDNIIAEYFDELENNPLEVERAIKDYNAVYGATCQQAVGTQISRFKSNDFFETVLIDEAARSNPLDLFIPMSLAKNRIILVGDHRQLPHIIDDKIEKKLELELQKNDTEPIAEFVEKQIKESLFEHLFTTLKAVEKKDGIKRTITLDTQYRMHPVHGDFISKVFYESNDEPYIKSGLPTRVFSHDLPNLKNKSVVWLKVDKEEGKEISEGSKYRPSEATRIATHLKGLIDSEEGKSLNFGIITFYRKQVDEILKALLAVGITEEEEGHVSIRKDYTQFTINNSTKERLRVGTVDAFQGKEFDVVYLSIVRSNDFTDKNEGDRIRKYGFIMSPNRLNVSMSRQKKLLIVAGDTEMLHTPNADKAILPLIEYYKLCKESEYGKII